MSLKNHLKKQVRAKIKKALFEAIKPFLPYILLIIGLFFAICIIIDVVFVQEVQADASSMSEIERALRTKCIEKSEFLNTCNNFIGEELTPYLLDMDSRETDKEVQWSHLYSLMTFHNLVNNTEIDEELLNKVSMNFKSTFKYEKMIIKTETFSVDENGNEIVNTSEQLAYILVESDTIIGHYKYNYEEITTELGNTKTTKKVFKNEELIGEKYARLRKYLKEELHISDSQIETDIEIVIQAANRLL